MIFLYLLSKIIFNMYPIYLISSYQSLGKSPT